MLNPLFLVRERATRGADPRWLLVEVAVVHVVAAVAEAAAACGAPCACAKWHLSPMRHLLFKKNSRTFLQASPSLPRCGLDPLFPASWHWHLYIYVFCGL
jgi:hypothetical protein